MTEAEQNYIRADKSDPFTAARIDTHKRLGMGYEATEHSETVKLLDGTYFSDGSSSYPRRVYRNLKR